MQITKNDLKIIVCIVCTPSLRIKNLCPDSSFIHEGRHKLITIVIIIMCHVLWTAYRIPPAPPPPNILCWGKGVRGGGGRLLDMLATPFRYRWAGWWGGREV